MKITYLTALCRLVSSLVFAASGLLTTPLLARAEKVELTRTTPSTATLRRADRLAIDRNGNFVVACSGPLSVAVAYNPPDPATSVRETVTQMIQRQEPHPISGFGFQVALSF